MGKNIIVLLVLFCLIAPYLIIAKPSYADISENSWITKAPMHEARSNLGVAVVSGKIYAIGGSTQNGSSPYTGGVVGTNEEYNPVTDTWTLKASMPTPRQSFAIAAYENKIYCIGGYDSDGNVVGVNEVYDPAKDIWETKAAMLTTRIALDANTVNGRIYLAGGYLPGEYTTYNFESSPLNEAYDPATNSWITCAPMPIASNLYASVVVDDKIYFMGGVTNYSSRWNQIYNPKTNNWSQGAPLPAGAAFAAAAVTTGVDAPKRVYVFGKAEGGIEAPYAPRVYDPRNDSWTFGSKLPSDQYYFGVASLNDAFYMIGGKTSYYQFPAYEVLFPPIITVYATNQQYLPIEYGTVVPVVSLLSPENSGVYNETNIILAFTVNKPVSPICYSLDGQENVTITGNTTLLGLTSGLHNVTIYATDRFENIGASETVTFSISEPESIGLESLQINSIEVAIAVSTIVIIVCLLVYLRKRKH